MSDTIAKDLRDYADCFLGENICTVRGADVLARVSLKAADRIEALEAENERLNNRIDWMMENCNCKERPERRNE